MAAALSDLERSQGSAWSERPSFPEDDPPTWTEAAQILDYERAASEKLEELDETRRGSPDDHYVSYQWHLSFYGQYALNPLAHKLHLVLDGSGLDLVADDRWQVPLLRVGGGDLTQAQLDKIEIRARDWAIDLHQFRVGLGPPVLRPGGIALSVTPWDELRDLRHGLWSGARNVLGYQPWLRERIPFRPHVPIAYATGPTPAGPLRERLAPLAHHKPVQIRVRRLTLARLTRHAGQAHWFTVCDMALGRRTAFYT